MPDLTIPAAHREAFQLLSRSPVPQFAAVAAVVAPDRANLDRSALIEGVVKAGFDRPDARFIIDALIGVQTLRQSKDYKTIDSMAEAVSKSKTLDLADEEREELRRRLIDILPSSSLEILGKGLDLISETERVCHDSRVITDIRPIFPPDDSLDGISGALIIHSVRLDYHQRRARKEFYISMTDGDLLELRVQIDRALEKGKRLKEMLGASAVPIINMEIEEGESA